jgi:hypothetical protein
LEGKLQGKEHLRNLDVSMRIKLRKIRYEDVDWIQPLRDGGHYQVLNMAVKLPLA